MKLTYITAANIPSKWAHSIQVMKMAQAFQQIGHDVELISACSFQEWHNKTESIWEQYGISSPFKLTRLPLSKLVEVGQRRNFSRFSYGYLAATLAKYRKTDVLFARDYLAPYWSTMKGIPTIAESHADPDESYQKKIFYEATKATSFKALVTISDILAEKYIRVGVPGNKVIVEQDGVDLSAFSSISEKEIENLRVRLLKGRKAIALYAGHLYDYKGIPLILEAAREMADVSFVLVGGWDEDIQRLKKIVGERGLKNLELTGYVSQSKVPVYLKAADVLLLPYTKKHHQASTTSPLKLFEYMASGKAIISAAIDNVTNVLTHEGNGILYEPDNLKAFIKGIKILLDKDKALSLAQQAQKDVCKYDWRERANRILRFSGF